MKKLIFTLAGMALLQSLAHAADITPASTARPLLTVRQGDVQLGKQDGSTLLQGEMSVFNAGAQTMHIVKPNALALSRLQFHYPQDLAIVPGKSLNLPWQYDLHGATPGEVEILLEVASDDPAAAVLQQRAHVQYAPQTQVTPFRSAVLATQQGGQLQAMEPVAFSFTPVAGKNIAAFTEVHLQDRASPLRLQDIKVDASGKLSGQVQIDVDAIAKGASASGETQVIANTAAGGQSYFLIQWAVIGQ